MKLEYVYLLRVYPANEKYIYKFGRTMRHFPERFKDYSAAKPTILLVLSCAYCKLLEKSTLDAIKDTFKMRKDIGNEYFEGDFDQVKRLVINQYRNHVKKYKCSGPTEDVPEESASSDAVNFEVIINEHNYAALNDDLAIHLKDADIPDLLDLCRHANNKRFIRFLHDRGIDIFGSCYEYYFKLPQNIRQFYSTMAPAEINLQDPHAIASALADTYLSKLVSQGSIKIYLIDCINHIDYEGYKKYIGLYVGDHSELVNMMELCDIEYFTGISARSHEVIDTEDLSSEDPDSNVLGNNRKGFIGSFLQRLALKFGKKVYKKY